MGSSCRDRVKSIGIFVLTACLICFIRCVWSDDESQSEGSLDEALHPEDRFPAFHHALETAIQDLGGKVIAKLGDTCPTVCIPPFQSSETPQIGCYLDHHRV